LVLNENQGGNTAQWAVLSFQQNLQIKETDGLYPVSSDLDA